MDRSKLQLRFLLAFLALAGIAAVVWAIAFYTGANWFHSGWFLALRVTAILALCGYAFLRRSLTPWIFAGMLAGAELGHDLGKSAADLQVLCISSGEAPDAPVPSHTAHQIDCCVLGGNALGKLLTPPPAGFIAAPVAQAAEPAVVVVETPALSRHHSPLTARGPPRV